MIRRTVLFSGRVQGVGFRFTACHIAESHDVTGYVKNLPDGRVEAVIEGTTGEVDTFVRAVRDAMSAYIRDCESHDSPATGAFDRFDVRF